MYAINLILELDNVIVIEIYLTPTVSPKNECLVIIAYLLYLEYLQSNMKFRRVLNLSFVCYSLKRLVKVSYFFLYGGVE